MYKHKKTRIAIPHIRVFLLPLPHSNPAQKNVHFILIFGTFRFADYTFQLVS